MRVLSLILACAVVVAVTATTSSVGHAAFIKKAQLKVNDVRPSVRSALADLVGNQVTLDRIIEIYQPATTELAGGKRVVQNTAVIYAELNGSLPQPGGLPFVFDGNIEQIFCQQTSSKRWLCFFTAVASLSGQPGIDGSFFLEK